MIRYKSTRGDKTKYTFSEAILKGIAADGGLLVPDKIPTFSSQQLQGLKNASYQEIAQFVFSLFQTDIPEHILQKIIAQGYGSQFDDTQITPVVHLKAKQYLLELWHGPTSAFKDMALQIMPLLFSYAAKMHDPSKKYLILVATSGDTGKAALEGYKDKKNISIMVFYPENRVSKIQQLQMQTQEGSNISIFAMQGDFDDCQRSVKEVFVDEAFQKKLLDEHNVVLSSANSINWGRLIPQIVYYVFAYLRLVQENVVPFGEPMDVSVPSGNFGNSLAALYAKKMGLPINKIICASNENNVLTSFLKTGIYDIRNRKIVETPSPAIDILVASNIERLLFLLTHDANKVFQWMQDLKNDKKFSVDASTKKLLQKHFAAGWVNTTDCLNHIKNIFAQTGYLMDPHTSVAQLVSEKYKTERPILILSTAHFSKFAKDVDYALEGKKREKDEFKILSEIKQIAPRIIIPNNIANLQKKKILHTDICQKGKEAIEDKILAKI